MPSAARINESVFRTTAGGREALAPPSEGGDHVHYQPKGRVGLGCITSRPRNAVTFMEVVAFEAGCTVAEIEELLKRERAK